MKRKISLMLVLFILLGTIPVYAAADDDVPPSENQVTDGRLLIKASETTIAAGNEYHIINVALEDLTGGARPISANYSIDNPTTVYIDGSNEISLNGNFFIIPLRTLEASEDKTVPINVSVTYETSTFSPLVSNEKVYLKNGNYFDKDGFLFNANNQKISKVNRNETVDDQVNQYNVFDIESGDRRVRIEGYPDIKEVIFKEMQTTSKTNTVNGIIYVIQKASPKDSSVEISKVTFTPQDNIKPGDNFNVSFDVTNTGNAPAQNIKLKLDGLAESNISVSSGLATKDIKVLEPGRTQTITFNLKAPASNPGGTFPLTLNYTFNGKTKGGAGTDAPMEGSYNLTASIKKANLSPSSIIFERINFPKGRLAKGREVEIAFSLKNIGNSPAQNIKITAASQDPTGLAPLSSTNAVVPKLNPGQVEEYKFIFKTTGSIQTQGYPVEIKVSYVDDETAKDAPHEISQIVTIDGVDWQAEAAKLKDSPKSVPKLIVEEYKFSQEDIYAGTEFDMTLVLYNTSDKNIENIKIFLTSDPAVSSTPEGQGQGQGATPTNASVFSPVESSNTFFVDVIKPGERYEKTITLTTPHDTQANTYTLTANMEYEDSQANPYTSTELIGITIIQDAAIGFGELATDFEYYVNTPGQLSINFFNTGKVLLSNFMVEFISDTLIADTQTYYRGNLATGVTDTFSTGITPTAPGENKGIIKFTFEDPTGKKHEIEKEVKVLVSDMPEMDPNMEGMEEFPEDGRGGLPIIPILIGLLVLGGGIGFFLYKRHKKKIDDEDLTINED